MSLVEIRSSQRVLWWIILCIGWPYSAGNNMCESPQYVKLGMEGMISCAFPDTFHGIYWYDKENVTSDDRPLISYVGGDKRGPGYDSDEYDIHPNGSLLINTVTHLHNHYYGVAVLKSPGQDPTFETVSVIVFAKPVGQYPEIGCEDEELCFLKVESPTSLSCSIDGVGEVIDDFSWMLRTKDRDKSTSSPPVIVSNSVNELQSYRVDVNVPLQTSPSLSLYVCSSKSPVTKVGSSEGAILVDHGTRTQNELSQTFLEKSLNETVTMECLGGNAFSLAWQKDSDYGQPIAYKISEFAGERIQKTNRGGFTLEDDNSLTINAVDEQSAGVYTCLYSEDGITTSYISYDVKIQEKANEGGRGLVIFIVVFGMVLVIITLVVAVIVMYRKKKTEGELSSEQSGPEGHPMMQGTGRNNATGSLKESPSKVIISSKETREKHDETLLMLKEKSGAQLKLENSFLSVDVDGSALHLTSKAVVHPNSAMRRLDFDFPSAKWREFDITELKSILQYVTRCKALKEITFINSLLPFELGDSIKKMKTIRVEWTTNTVLAILKPNCVTGKWKNSQDEELREDDYKKIVEKARESMKDAAEQPGDKHGVNTRYP